MLGFRDYSSQTGSKGQGRAAEGCCVLSISWYTQPRATITGDLPQALQRAGGTVREQILLSRARGNVLSNKQRKASAKKYC